MKIAGTSEASCGISASCVGSGLYQKLNSQAHLVVMAGKDRNKEGGGSMDK